MAVTRMGALAMNLALLGYPLEVARSAPRLNTPVNGGSKRTRARRRARARAKRR